MPDFLRGIKPQEGRTPCPMLRKGEHAPCCGGKEQQHCNHSVEHPDPERGVSGGFRHPAKPSGRCLVIQKEIRGSHASASPADSCVTEKEDKDEIYNRRHKCEQHMPPFPWITGIVEIEIGNGKERCQNMQAQACIMVLPVGSQKAAGHHRSKDRQINKKRDEDGNYGSILHHTEGSVFRHQQLEEYSQSHI